MKTFVCLLALLMVSFGFVAAQSTTTTTNSNPWGNYNLSPAVSNYVQNGGAIPQGLAGKVISAASNWGFANFGFSLMQMWSLYNGGKITITLVATSPPSLTFRVSYSGTDTLLLIDAI